MSSDAPREIRTALELAAADPEGRSGFYLDAGCLRGSTWRSMRIFESGVAIWGDSRQFRLTEHDIIGLLQQLLEADIASLPDRFGGSRDPDRMQTNSARTVVCSLRVATAEVSKEVIQINRGEQSESFARLVNGLLDSVEEQAAGGAEAESLEDGLEKIGADELDPVTLEIHYQELSEAAGPGETGVGIILRLEGLKAEARVRDSEDGYSEASRLELSEGEVSQLAWRLAERDPTRFPRNLWAPGYRDLTIRVLNQKTSLVARPYGGVGPETHGTLQDDFDAVVELLESLHRRVLDAGVVTQ